jgi:hypothetical protein
VSAPHLVTRVLNQLADDEQETFPEAVSVAKRDDVLSGANIMREVFNLQQKLDQMLRL